MKSKEKQIDQESIRIGLNYIHKAFELAKITDYRANESGFDTKEAENLLDDMDALWDEMDQGTIALCVRVLERFNEVKDIIVDLRKKIK